MPGLTSMPDAPTVARIVIAATGESPNDLRITGSGVTSVAWRADTDGGSYCVLIATPRESYLDEHPFDEPRYAARAAVLASLNERDPRCPRVIATHRSTDIPPALSGHEWIVTSWVEGDVPGVSVADAVARDLGEVVRALHETPATGHGPLVDEPEIRGRSADRAEAFASIWGGNLWPYNGHPLSTHPLVRIAPHLVLPVASMREPLLQYVERAAPALCHMDLHPWNFMVRDGRLSGLIDFGDCAVMPASFDIARFALDAGWAATEHFLEGYAPNRVLRDLRRAEAQQIAVVIALRYLASPRPNPERVRSMVTFLEETLPLAARRGDA